MNDLLKYFENNSGNLIRKWEHYFDIYDHYFKQFRNKKVHVLEFGVLHGGSLQMWKHYFGPNSKIYGVDINPQCKQLEEEQIEIFIGDQGDKSFLESLIKAIPRVDILINDGGHEMLQQKITFEVLFPHIEPDGVYLCEDLHTSYYKSFGGGLLSRHSFIEFSKSFIDAIHAWFYSGGNTTNISEFTKSVYALHYYTSVLVIEKKSVEKPRELKSGFPRVEPFRHEKRTFLKRLLSRYRR